MNLGPFFRLKRKNGDEIIMGPIFGWTVFMVALLFVLGYLAVHGVVGWQEIAKLAVPIK
jgi:hypothetical protein